MLPKISVVTPNRNGARFLEATIRSVVEQNYPLLQYVVVDGDSSDDSPLIIQRYAERIATVIREPDDGHGDSLAKGFACTDGEIMAWVNSDDMYLPWTFSVVAQIFNSFPDVRWIEGLPSRWDADGRLVSVVNSRPINRYDYLNGRYQWIQQESVFWRRSLWDEAGGYIDTRISLMVDGELWSRFFRHAELYRVDTVLGGFRLHDSNRSRRFDHAHAEMRAIIERMRAASTPAELSAARCMKWAERILSPFSTGVLNRLPKVGKRKVLRHVGHPELSTDGNLWRTEQHSYR